MNFILFTISEMILIASAFRKRVLCNVADVVERKIKCPGISIYLLTVMPQSQISAACRYESALSLCYSVLTFKKRQDHQIMQALVESLHPSLLSKVAKQQSIIYEVGLVFTSTFLMLFKYLS